MKINTDLWIVGANHYLFKNLFNYFFFHSFIIIDTAKQICISIFFFFTFHIHFMILFKLMFISKLFDNNEKKKNSSSEIIFDY